VSDPVIGIDLGTTNTVVAALGPDGPVVLRDAHGAALLPSAVAVDDAGNLLVGAAAAARLGRIPSAGVRGFKRDMGTDRRFRLGGRELGAIELSAIVLRATVERASAALGEPARRAIIGVPAYFQEPQRAATLAAADLAGITCLRLVNEPTAAAIAYGAIDPTRERRVAVLDLGGGTFDVSLIEVFEGVIQVVGTAGNARLGGEDFTDRLTAWASAEAGLPAYDPDAPSPVHALLREACEQAKCALASADAVRLALPGPDPSTWTPGPARMVTRAMLDRLCAPLVVQAMQCVSDALAHARWRPNSVDEVVLAGGATRMAAFRANARERLGRDPVDGPDPDLVVALGAALEAGLVARDARAGDLVVTDVLAHSLGVELARMGKDRVISGYFAPILHRNTTLPARRVERVYAMHPQQPSVRLRVFQGDHRLVEENTPLGELEIGDLPRAATADGACQAIDVSFTHDLNGLLEVEATVVSNGRAASILVENRSGRLTPAERAIAVAALAALKVHPRDLLPNRLLLEEAHTRFARLPTRKRELLDPVLFAFEEALARQDADDAARAATQLRSALAHPALDDDAP
jgi:molecular chaperone HscC